MSSYNKDHDEISSIIDQISHRLPSIEEEVAAIKSEIPPNLSNRLFNIQASLRDIDEQVKYKNVSLKSKNHDFSDQPVKNNATPVPVSEDHDIQIEKHKRYLKKHLNNAIQKNLSELDIKMKKIESDFIPYLNSRSNTPASSFDSFTKLERRITKSFNEFNSKYQDLYSQITRIHVQRKFSYENTSNQLTRSINMRIRQQQNDIQNLKIKIDETQKLIDNYNINKGIKAEKPNQNEPVLPDIKKINQEQKNAIDVLTLQWIDIRDTFKRQLTAVNKSFNDLLQSNEKAENSLNNYKQKLSKIFDDRTKNSENLSSIQVQINNEMSNLEESSLKDDIVRLKLNVALSFENDRNLIDEVENYVDHLNDRIIESFSD